MGSWRGKEKAEGTSWLNETEIEALEALLQSALAWNDISPREIGIITPYAAQARLIRRRLGCPPPGKRVPQGAVGVALVEVSSVDGFQGREKDLILVSTVRANTSGKVGFLGDPRRLNVTITRSRRGLVVVGHFETLAADEHTWRPWLTWAQERGLVVGCEATNQDAANALKQRPGAVFATQFHGISLNFQWLSMVFGGVLGVGEHRRLETLSQQQLLRALDNTYTTKKS